MVYAVMQLQKTSEEREGQVEELSQELKAACKEIGRLHNLDQQVKDVLNDIKQIQADKDRYLRLLSIIMILIIITCMLSSS